MKVTLINVFKALNQKQIKYCLLRGMADLSENLRKKEVDLLVPPDYLPEFVNTVAKLGFFPIPSWGHAPHYFFVAFDKTSDTWLKLDVVIDLVYGKPIPFLRVELTERCLANRIQQGDIYVLSPEDGFITLLLHCLLDKGAFRAKHCQRLASLKETTTKDVTLKQRLESYLKHYFPQTFHYGATIEAIERGDWQWFLDQQAAVKHRLFWKQPLTNIWRKLSTRLLRLLRPVLFMLSCHGVSIALLAPDGAGKTTLAKALGDEDILRARLIYMGTNADASTVGSPATDWLKEHIKSLDERKKSLRLFCLKVINYGNRVLEQWLRYSAGFYHKCLGRFVIFDRYVYDSFLAPPAKTMGKRLRRGLLLKTCPSPDLVILLDAPGEVLFQRKGEHSAVRLEKQRQIFLKLKDRIPNMIVVDATGSPNQVRCEILEKIWHYYGAHAIGHQ
jgi:thymidylate kinase